MAWLSQVSVDTSVTCDSGWCLWLAEECVGAPHAFPTARAAWDNNTQQHADRDYPRDAVVALFWSWTSKSDGIDYGHVVINVPGQGLFSSPKRWGQHGNDWYGSIDEVSNWLGAEYLGWTSELAGLQLAVWQDDAPLAGNQRRAGAQGVFRRAEPNTWSEHLQPDLEAGEVGNFNGWIHGEDRGGNDIWFQGVSGNWFWSGAFENPSPDGINDLNPVSPPVLPEPVVTPEPVTDPVVEPSTPEPEQPTVVEPAPEQTTNSNPKPTKEEQPVSAEETAKQEAEIATLPAADLGAIIPSAKGRKVAYAIYAGISLIVTNTAVAFAALQTSFPAWLVVAIAVVGNLATPFSAIAIANATDKAK